MADNSNIGYGVKISQLDWASDVVPDNYTVLVQNSSNGLKTTKAKISDLLDGVRKQDTELVEKVSSLEKKTSTLSSSLNNTINSLNTLKRNHSSDMTAVNGELYALSDAVFGPVISFETRSGGLVDKVEALSNSILAVSGPLSDLVSNPDLISGIQELVEKLSGSDLSTSIVEVSKAVEELSASLSVLEESVPEDFAKANNYIAAVSDKVNGIYNNSISKNLVNIPLVNALSTFNPLYAETNSNYEWYDRYCFANTKIETEESFLSVDPENGEILSIDQDNDYQILPMPGLATFELEGIPLRAGMFYNGNLTLTTRGDSTVEIYLNNAAYSTDDNLVLSTLVNNSLVSKKSLKKTEKGSDIDLDLVWSGFLESNSKISFMTDSNATSISTYNLLGMVVPTLNRKEIEQVNDMGISLIDITVIGNYCELNYAINGGYHLQNVPITANFSFSDERNDIEPTANFDLNISPSVNDLNRFSIANIQIGDITNLTSVKLTAYNDVLEQSLTATYEGEDLTSKIKVQ